MFTFLFSLFILFKKALKNSELLHVLHCGVENGQKYPENVRHFCLALDFYSPRAYEYIRKSFNNHLPHRRTMRSWHQNSDIKSDPGIQEVHMTKLKKIANDYKEKHGHDLVCSLVFDEMNIRKQIYWSLQQLDYVGYVNYGQDMNDEQKTVARQAIVFILNGINANFEFPVAYYFINTLKHESRNNLLNEIIAAVTECGICISNITFDGYTSNVPMCQLFGADLDIHSPTFQTFFLNPVNKEKIYIIIDPCHMEKCLRNALAGSKVLYDDRGEKIEWRYIESLYDYCKKHSIHTNKLSKKHINWKDHKMNVAIAVETMSESVACTMEYLMKQNVPEFEGASATIKFIRVVDTLFDIFNSKSTQNNNIFKRSLNEENKRVVFDYLENCIQYFKGFKVSSKICSEIFFFEFVFSTFH